MCRDEWLTRSSEATVRCWSATRHSAAELSALEEESDRNAEERAEERGPNGQPDLLRDRAEERDAAVAAERSGERYESKRADDGPPPVQRPLLRCERLSSLLAGARKGHLAELFAAAGLRDVEEAEVAAALDYETFDEWWEPYTLGVGPAGAYARSLGDEQLARLRDRCRDELPRPPFDLKASAWAARGLV